MNSLTSSNYSLCDLRDKDLPSQGHWPAIPPSERVIVTNNIKENYCITCLGGACKVSKFFFHLLLLPLKKYPSLLDRQVVLLSLKNLRELGEMTPYSNGYAEGYRAKRRRTLSDP
mmetsp:Transcript_39198/g.117865  ORF Transcript_39198/g.117865 Transcript_39198/m.117865 type:complete len:115 (-) Transcript_39198:646-990(-)